MKNTPFNVMRHNNWDRAPRMPEAIALFVFGPTFGATATAIFITQVVISAVTSWALQALAPKPTSGVGTQGLLTNARNPAAPHEYVYGEVRKGGVVTYIESTGENNKFLHQIIVLAGHAVEEIGDIFINDEVVTFSGDLVTSAPWNSKIRIQKFDGTQTTAPASLLAESNQINANFIGRGLAYLYVRLEYDQDVFANGIPLFTAKVKGKKVFDPRTSTTAYSANAALCIRDYLVTDYGMADVGSTNDIVFSAAANVCDENVGKVGGGTEKRYEMNGVISASLAPGDILQSMMTSCAGTLFWGQGKWQLRPGYYTAPTKTLTLDDLRGPISLSTRTSRRDNFNIVRGKFNDAAQRYITSDYPELRSAAFIAEDNGLENALDLEFPLTTSAAMAQRLAKLTLFRGREQMSFSADFSMAAFDVQVGDIIALTNPRYGFNEKEFEVLGWRFVADGDAGDLRVNLSLRETSEAAFDWNAEESAIISNNTNLPSAFTGLDVTNLTVSGGGRTQSDGTFVNAAILSWTAAPSAFVDHYQIEYRPVTDSNFASTTTVETSVEVAPVIDAIEYTFRVRAVSVTGVRGPFTSATFTVGGDVIAPGLPTAISATGHFEYISIKWTNPSNVDLNFVEVYENTSDTTVGSTLVGVSSGDTFQRTNLGPAVTRFYFLKSVDYSGNASAFTAGVSATTKFIDDADFVDGVVNLFLDQGLGPIPNGNTFPSSPSNADRFFLTTDGQLYKYNGTATRWELEAEPGSIVASDKIIANTITGGLLAASGVITNSAQIDNAVITNAKIADLAVDRIKLGLGSVTDFLSVSNAVSKTVSSYGAFESIGSTTSFTLPSNALESPQALRVSGGIATDFSAIFVLSSSVQILSFEMRLRVYNETLSTYVADGPTRTIRSFSARGGAIPLTLSGSSPNITISSFYTTAFLVSTSSNSPEQVLTLNIPPNSTTIRPGDTLRLEIEVRKDRNFTNISSVVSVTSVLYQVETYYR